MNLFITPPNHNIIIFVPSVPTPHPHTTPPHHIHISLHIPNTHTLIISSPHHHTFRTPPSPHITTPSPPSPHITTPSPLHTTLTTHHHTLHPHLSTPPPPGSSTPMDISSITQGGRLLMFSAGPLSYGFWSDAAASSNEFSWLGSRKFDAAAVKTLFAQRYACPSSLSH